MPYHFRTMNLQSCLPGLFVIPKFIASLQAEPPIQAMSSSEKIFRVPASRFQNRSPEQLSLDLGRGIGPDEAAAIALYSNPALRAIRDRRGLAAAQLIRAGILPNPSVSYARDFVSGGETTGATTAYNIKAGGGGCSLFLLFF